MSAAKPSPYYFAKQAAGQKLIFLSAYKLSIEILHLQHAMKRILYTLLFLPVFAQAQHWKLGLNVGVSAITELGGFTDNTKMRPSSALMLTASRAINPRVEIGVQMMATRLVRVSNDITSFNANGSPVGTYIDARVHIGKAAFLITPFLSWHIRRFYLGAQGGYFTTLDGQFDNSGKHAMIYVNNFKGFTLGIHAGHDWPVTKNLLLNAELRANYIHARLKPNAIVLNGFNTFQGAIMIGAKYIIGGKKL